MARSSMWKCSVAAAVGVAIVLAGCAEPVAGQQRPGAGPGLLGPGHLTLSATTGTPPNLVLILTDDQRFGTLWAMPNVRRRLVARGIDFIHAYVSNPLCCPSRATILTGLYSHSTGVYTNRSRDGDGGFAAFHDRSTLATWLQGAGYRTALMGKYLNGYHSTYVPPGWNRWFATYDNGGYYDYRATDDGVQRSYGSDPKDYGTNVLARQAADFIRTTSPGQPLFLYFAPHAPHSPAIPARQDRSAFSDLRPWRPRSYDEARISDKPSYIRSQGLLSPTEAASVDGFRRDQYRSLLAVDRAVGRILDTLRRTGRLSNTAIVFMSDNGMLWGEHRWSKKVVPYEESLHVPFVVRADFLDAVPRTDGHLVANLDIAPTFTGLAGAQAPAMEGRNLLPILRSPDAPWRSSILIEHSHPGTHGVPTYCGVHSVRYAYWYYATGEEELYDLRRDRFELSNRAGAPAYRSVLERMRTRLAELCRPAPPGLTIPF